MSWNNLERDVKLRKKIITTVFMPINGSNLAYIFFILLKSVADLKIFLKRFKTILLEIYNFN